MKIKRGDIWYVRLDPAEGGETKKTRPCLVIQNDIGNQYANTTIVSPFLKPGNYPFIVNVQANKLNGLDQLRGLNLSKIRTVSILRFNNKIGEIDGRYWEQIKNALLAQCGFINT